MNSNDTRILVKDFNFYYGDFKALKDINMEIKKNKVTALIGPSGCGKSTFLRSINRMNDLIPNVKYEGNIIFDGKNIFDKEYDIVEIRKMQVASDACLKKMEEDRNRILVEAQAYAERKRADTSSVVERMNLVRAMMLDFYAHNNGSMSGDDFCKIIKEVVNQMSRLEDGKC